MLAPVFLLMGWAMSRIKKGHGHGRARAPIPWFVIGFIVMILFNSLGVLPEEARHGLVHTTTFLLTMALAAMGLDTDIRKLRAQGLRPLALGPDAARRPAEHTSALQSTCLSRTPYSERQN